MGLWDVLLPVKGSYQTGEGQQSVGAVLERKYLRGMTGQPTETMEAPSVLLCKGYTTSHGVLLTDEKTRSKIVYEERSDTLSVVS